MFPSNGHTTRRPLPSTGSSRASSPASTVLSGAATSCRPSRRASLPSPGRYHGSTRTFRSRCRRVPRRRARGWSPGPLPGSLPWRRQDLPRSWGTKTVLLPCSSTPAGPTHQAISMRRCCPRTDHNEGSRNELSRLDRTASALAVYASWGNAATATTRSPGPTQDSLPAAGQALPDGLEYPHGSNERFQTHIMFAILLSQAFVAQGQTLNISTARLLLLGHFGRLAHTGGDGGHGRKG